MSQPAILNAITLAAEELDADQQELVLAYVQSVKKRPKGTVPANLLKFAGSIPPDDCAQMQQVIASC